MDNPTHTPGPWQVVAKGKAQSQWIVGDSEGGSIADCEPAGPWMRNEEADANARLIAAAPDMLAALQLVLADAEHSGFDNHTLQQVRAAVAKAAP